MTGTCSHNATAERQYRYPTEYGAQKPPTAQWTVTGAGAAVVMPQGEGPCITSATIGRVVDLGVQDPFNMGAAMAPAAVDTIQAHFTRFADLSSTYDLIPEQGIWGGWVIRQQPTFLAKHDLPLPVDRFLDCGLMIYREDQPVHAGASGCASSACVTYGHILNRFRRGELNKVLIVATGALYLPLAISKRRAFLV